MNHNENLNHDFEKDFEKQYIEYSKNDAPDLWARIEAGLPGGVVSPMQGDEVTKSAGVLQDRMTQQNVKPTRKLRWYHYSPVIAACVCLVIMIPMIRSMMFGTKEDSARTEVAMDGDYNMSAESASASDTAGSMNDGLFDGDAKPESDAADVPTIDRAESEEVLEQEEAAETEDAKDESLKKSEEDWNDGDYGDADGSSTDITEDAVTEDAAPEETLPEVEKVKDTEGTITILGSVPSDNTEEVYYLCELQWEKEACSIYIKSQESLENGKIYAVRIELLREAFNGHPVYRLIEYAE